jgi:hypothetical protein
MIARACDVSFNPLRDFRAGRLIPVLSDVTAAEVQDTPERVRELHQEILTIVETVLPLTEDALLLVAAYADRKILPTKYEADMRHIALATLDRVDALVSWNFKHIVRLEKIRQFNEVNVQLGIRP